MYNLREWGGEKKAHLKVLLVEMAMDPQYKL